MVDDPGATGPSPTPTGDTGASPTPPAPAPSPTPQPRITADTEPAPAEKPQTPQEGEFTGDEAGWAPGAYARFRESRQQLHDLKAQYEEAQTRQAEYEQAVRTMAPAYREARERADQERMQGMEPEERVAFQRQQEMEALEKKLLDRIGERDKAVELNVSGLMTHLARQQLETQYPEFMEDETLQKALLDMAGDEYARAGDVMSGVQAVLNKAQLIKNLVTMGEERAFNKAREQGFPTAERGGVPSSPPPQIKELAELTDQKAINAQIDAKWAAWDAKNR